jgi:hypothetical protein
LAMLRRTNCFFNSGSWLKWLLVTGRLKNVQPSTISLFVFFSGPFFLLAL